MKSAVHISSADIKLSAIQHVYFLGIGGIGMSALARYFHLAGKVVSGYDKTATPLTDKLQEEGISIHFEDDIRHIPVELKEVSRENSLIVYTPAIPSDLKEFNYLKENGFAVMKRSQALGLITSETNCLAVAGTHGKTTTSTLLAHMLKEAKVPLTAFLGGISVNLESNFTHDKDAEHSVVEADEFDRSFLSLSPAGAIITSVEADHLDIYGEEERLVESFINFAQQVKTHLILHEDVNEKILGRQELTDKRIYSYGWSSSSDYTISNYTIENSQGSFSLRTPKEEEYKVSTPLPGRHNVENATAALALAEQSGQDISNLIQGLTTFKGIKRRFEFKSRKAGRVYIDDYAHHPTELKAAIQAAQELYPEEKIVGIFQPHLFSRTRDFMEEFAAVLGELDSVILLEIYPAREKPIDGISSQALLNKISSPNKELLSKEETIAWVKNHLPPMLMTLGAGDIDQLVNPINELYHA